MKVALAIVASSLIIVSLVVFVVSRRLNSPSPTPSPSFVTSLISSPLPPSSPLPAGEAVSPLPSPATKLLRAQDIPDVAAAFTFIATIPIQWEAEAILASEAINLYDPASAGKNNLEKSQIFIRHFKANQFLTLSTVTIHDRQELIVNDRPAVRYDIEKKAGVANFTNQPTWRNERHIVTDIQTSDDNPTIFYVMAQRPGLNQTIYQGFLDSLVVSPKEDLVEPIAEFRQRITKKPFGILIDPATSPVQPERFSGYHTGVDVEYNDASDEVPVRAIAAGTVVLARTASGYGGVAALRHHLVGTDRIVIYGHLDPSALPAVNQHVTAGETISRLGEGNTSETDGERMHLHFAVRADTNPDLRGYVANQSDLGDWLNPQEIF